LDIASAPRLERTLRRAGQNASLVVLDLRGLTFIDSSGAHVIVSAAARAKRAGHRLMLIRGPAQIDRLLALTGDADVLDIRDLDSVEPHVQALPEPTPRDHAA
jgi:anti-sigma B factor antagonist